ncbi:MAG: antitoxin MazE family protein [Rhizobium rhizophilum]|uniref:antitoxin MazE family protein n=1 Tax=Rhizobium rhizophilum TaxID=1850373 RepID=UPI003919D6BB
MATSVGRRVQKRRENLRAQGLRPVQIWLPDTRRPGFAEECARQAQMTAEADRADLELNAFLDHALFDLQDIDPAEEAGETR